MSVRAHQLTGLLTLVWHNVALLTLMYSTQCRKLTKNTAFNPKQKESSYDLEVMGDKPRPAHPYIYNINIKSISSYYKIGYASLCE